MSASKIRVISYSNLDEKVFVYKFEERELQEIAAAFTDDIFFTLTDDELWEFMHQSPETVVDNLKNDFIWFRPSASGRQIIQCTCGQFLESGHSLDKLAKQGYKHHQRTGHSINLRGN